MIIKNKEQIKEYIKKRFLSLKRNNFFCIFDPEDRSVLSVSIRWVCNCEWVVRVCMFGKDGKAERDRRKGRELTERKGKRERAWQRGCRRCRQLRLKCKGIHAAQPIYMRLAGPVLKSAGYPPPSFPLPSRSLLAFSDTRPALLAPVLLYIRSIRLFVENVWFRRRLATLRGSLDWDQL